MLRFLTAAALCLATLQAAPPAVIDLPKAVTQGGKPLMEALALRRSTREFSPRKLAPQVLSDLLWAAYGINRPENAHRTAPSAMNRQSVDIYVALEEGLYKYEAVPHRLVLVAPVDARKDTGTQNFVAGAPLNLVYVADMKKMQASGGAQSADMVAWSAIEAGAVVQNVYLFCASQGLVTVVRASINREAFAKVATLAPDQRILVAQTIGYPR
jgi:nitroreductase